ncbi:MAG TPA: FAD-dependent oxidoreductase [bacterium]|nr:FAD-dependent oxidoreductase [bacterium]
MEPASPGKPKLVVLGTGFGGFSLLKRLDPRAYDVTVISSRNHFLFTPLLPSSTVGTVEFRSIIEPIRRSLRNVRFHLASVRELDAAGKTIRCVVPNSAGSFELPYDLLVVAVGAKVNTFGIPGVSEHALFLKTVEDARRIRRRTIECFEEASEPNISPERRRELLHFVVVGGGPTGVEFAAELHDFVMKEVRACYPSLIDGVRITLVDAADHILGAFDKSLSDYTTRHFQRQNIQVRTGIRTVRLEKDRAVLNDGSTIPFGMVVWSTGLGPTIAVNNFDLPKDKASRILVDDYLKVQGREDVFAMGDCSCVAGRNYPATAQVAMQEGIYLGKALNRLSRNRPVHPFKYNHHGMLAYIGDDSAIADMAVLKAKGRTTYLFWRSAYLTRLVSWKNKILVVFDWFKAFLFGRDISRF